ncbi:MAG: tRNA (cytidine(34)-2'-O)-methyltransferase [Clostridiaceae bacterium]
MLNIVLFEPEIPQNTGNIGRTCVLTGSKLHLIKPLGFEISDKQIRRTGLDYWKELNLEVHESWNDFIEKYGNSKIYAVTTKGTTYFDEVTFEDNDFLLFGRESSGLPDSVRERLKDTLIRIPMIKTLERSLNLSNAVAIVGYKAMEDLSFPDMK